MAETVETVFPSPLYARRKERAFGIFPDSGVITAKPMKVIMWKLVCNFLMDCIVKEIVA